MARREPTGETTGNGTPPFPRLDTEDPVVQKLSHSLAGAGPEADQNAAVAKAIIAAFEAMRGGGGNAPPPGSIPPEAHAKAIKKSNWKALVGAIATALTVGGGAFMGVKSMAESNHHEIKALQTNVVEHAEEPMHDEAREEVEYIKARINKIDTEQKTQGIHIKYIKDGIDDLKDAIPPSRRRRGRRGQPERDDDEP